MKLINYISFTLILLVSSCNPSAKDNGNTNIPNPNTINDNCAENDTNNLALSTNKNDEVIEKETDVTAQVTEEEPTVPDYKIHKRKRDKFYLNGATIFKVTYTLIIPDKYDKSQLNQIFNFLMNNEESGDNIFVEYYLKGNKPSGPNYALSSRVDGTLDTTIHYEPPVEETFNFNSVLNGESKDIIGKWKAIGNNILILYKNGKNYYGIFCWGKDSYNGPFDYVKTSYKGGTAFYCPDAPEEVFVIGKNKALKVYGNGKYITTYEPVK